MLKIDHSPSRKRARHIIAAALAGSSLLLTACARSVPEENLVDGNEAVETAQATLVDPPAPPIKRCDDTTTITDRDMAVRTEADSLVRAEPRPDGPTIPWNVGDEIIPYQIDDSVYLREQCRVPGWSMIKLLGPSEFRKFEGWVPTNVLRAVPLDARGRRIYVASDIEWPEGSRPYRSQIVTIINKIMRDDERCEAILTDQLVVNDRGSGPIYSIPCDGPQEMASIDFRPQDASNGRSFKMGLRRGPVPTTPIDKTEAVMVCETAISKKLVHPNIDFHILTGTVFGTDGARARLTIDMSYENGFGGTRHSAAECTFEGTELKTVAEIPRAM